MPPENVSQQLTEHVTLDWLIRSRVNWRARLCSTGITFSVVSHDAFGVDGMVYTNGLLWLFIVFHFDRVTAP